MPEPPDQSNDRWLRCFRTTITWQMRGARNRLFILLRRHKAISRTPLEVKCNLGARGPRELSVSTPSKLCPLTIG